jgi:CelD/BcsL family acetyltransferase involved in cellulose biosynthesis
MSRASSNGSHAVVLERVDLAAMDWSELDGFGDRLVFQTPEWLAYVAETQGAEPVVAALRAAGQTIGWFTGLVVRKYGVRILGSPFAGWTTGYMGFNLIDGVDRATALGAVAPFAFGELGCMHVELRDRWLEPAAGAGQRYELDRFVSYDVDLSQGEDAAWGAMSSACRRAVRKAEKSGLTIEECDDLGFAADYHSQLVDVFAKQERLPTYGRDRVEALIRHVGPSGNLLLLRARDPEGRCIATGIFPGLGSMMYFWGGASWREHQILRPNEAIFWHAMRYWAERGVTRFDMGGGGDYKAKYGGKPIMVPTLSRSRMPGLTLMRDVAERLYTSERLRRLRRS